VKLVIAGSRSIAAKPKTIDRICQKAQINTDLITEVVSGKARGIDTAGELFAETKAITVKDFPADWTKYGKGAGPIRNKQMAEYCDFGIIIWDGYSSGSLNMMDHMNKLRKPYYLVIVEKSGNFRTRWVNGDFSSLL
jgi:phage tail protein X